MTDIQSYLEENAVLINNTLSELLPQLPEESKILSDAMRYSLTAGGKRLRPILFMVTLEAMGRDPLPLLPFACALEMIHTFSLIHDDLPAMDNDDYRRGKPTCHKVFGENQAILAGDALLAHAFAIMANQKDKVEAKALLDAIAEIALATGLSGMITGQVMDVARDGKELPLEELALINRYKTGALFRGAIRSAAIIGSAPPEKLAALTVFAEQFGLAFQIIDDILDVTGDEKRLGKPLGSDLKNSKTTYPSLLGLEEAKNQAAAATREAIAALACLGEKADMLIDITDHLLNREY